MIALGNRLINTVMIITMMLMACARGQDVAFAVGTEDTPSGTVSIFLYSQATGQQTWLQHGLGAGTATCLTCVTARTCWVAGWSGFMERTTDGANSWVEQDTRTSQQFTGIAAVSETVVWAVTKEGGVFVTTNGGATWSSRSIDPTKGKQDIYFRSNLRGWIVGSNGDTWRTEDGGNTWVFRNAGTSETLFGVFFLNQNFGYAVGSNGIILRTTNGAAASASDVTWTQLNAGTTIALQSVFVTPDRTIHIVGWGQEYFRSTDEGSTWSSVSLPVNAFHYAVAFLDNNNGWVSGGQGSIHVTTNGGSSWTRTCCNDVSGPVQVAIARKPPVEAGCANPTAQLLLTADSRPSSTIGGFVNSVSRTICMSSPGPLYLSGDTSVNGDMSSLDDMLVYQIATNRVVGLAYSGSCAASGFLSMAQSGVQQVGSRGNGPAVALGTISASQFTLKVGINDCGGAASNGNIYLVGCSLIDCQATPATTTTPSSSSGSGSGSTVWSGQYQVTSSCGSGCCCIGGTFSLTQSGTQVTGTVGLTGSCQGQTSAPISVTLPSATATSVSTTVLGQRMNIVKNGATVTLDNLDASQCSGTATCTSGDCRSSSSGQSGGAGASAGGGNVCFHESTVIEYQGQRYTMQDLLKGKVEQCHVPHVIHSSTIGVIIETDCSSSQQQNLHLTGDHLVYTMESGLKAAQDVAVGEVLFANLQQSKRCTVTKVTRVAHSHSKEETYFGLNCVGSSQVLANGIKTSTFGHYHAVPAAWMRVVGQCFGIERASRWGNSLANWWHKH